jgi:hypothetical protein
LTDADTHRLTKFLTDHLAAAGFVQAGQVEAASEGGGTPIFSGLDAANRVATVEINPDGMLPNLPDQRQHPIVRLSLRPTASGN